MNRKLCIVSYQKNCEKTHTRVEQNLSQMRGGTSALCEPQLFVNLSNFLYYAASTRLLIVKLSQPCWRINCKISLCVKTALKGSGSILILLSIQFPWYLLSLISINSCVSFSLLMLAFMYNNYWYVLLLMLFQSTWERCRDEGSEGSG